MGSYDLMVAQVAQNNGVNHGHAIGVQQGKKIGEVKGWNKGLKSMQSWVDKANRLESIFANGGLNRLWLNKMVFATNPRELTKDSLASRRLLFLSMLSHAEYHQRHVIDPVALVGSTTIHVEEDIARSKALNMKFDDSMAAFIAQGDNTVESAEDKLKRTRIKLAVAERRIDEIERRVISTNDKARKMAASMRSGQKDENMDDWIAIRIKYLSKHVKYSTKDGIIPDAGSLGNAATSKKAGYVVRKINSISSPILKSIWGRQGIRLGIKE